MRLLTNGEVALVSGALSAGDVGKMITYISTNFNLRNEYYWAMRDGASRLSALRIVGMRAAGGVGLAAQAGWELGGLLNEYTPIQEWIGDAIDAVMEQ